MVNKKGRRKLDRAIGMTREAQRCAAEVGILHGFTAVAVALEKDRDASDWEAELSDTLVKAVKLLHKAETKLCAAIEIIEDNGGFSDENRS